MEEKKFDVNSLIGFLLLGAIMVWYMYTNQPTPEELEKQKTEQRQDSTQKANQQQIAQPDTKVIDSTITTVNPTDSLALTNAQSQLGVFAYSATLPSATANETVLENDLVKIKVGNKGGQITEVELKNFKTHDQKPLYLIKDNNALFNINFATTDNRTLNTKDLFFEPTLTKNGENQVLSMKLKVSNNQFLEYRYEIKPGNYMLDFAIKSQGMDRAINTSQSLQLDWDLKAYRQEKSAYAENMYSWYYYKADDDVSYLSSDDEDELVDVNWVAFKQHFFTSILKTDTPLSSAKVISKDLIEDDEKDTIFTKKFSISAPLNMKNGELDYAMNWYYGPTDFNVFKQYKGTDIKEVADLGWGIFGWINRIIFIPVFTFLSSFIGNYGLIIILMTIVVRIIMSPVVYKSYLSSAKMKVLRPEMQEINERLKGKENAMKRQQETMALQRKAGVSPLSGCIPALIQMPVFFALFKFFPTQIGLRQKSFLWAEDLASYDTIAKLPEWLDIPFYGNHVSLFPILASVAIFFYMRMTQSQQMNMQQPTQEGMPDMGKMMKYMMYFSPIMMLFFFNNYASSLSLYYFVSNLLTIVIMLVIKKFIIDEDKIHAQIQENKAKPEKKKSKFRQRLDDAMKQAQEQQAQQKKKK
ncbi:membrane protein insertase YidC [Aureibaculum sp. 2210JD6-5]|uniref:membrane protein insertase YidC n=1 Tax=Aureibaculum sp. 2210JD6-5 TaxID=3103957 RepID=UPI002AAEB7BE|nr:membrane protein insertase YidC [Aureibaculum sp. 2210JD6-5]MDY7395066.1 membrane protein insertase YidC [Aureibaculum sp. 2210JD6-5]